MHLRLASTCPVRAPEAWLDAAEIAEGTVFRGISVQRTTKSALTRLDVP